MAHTSQAMLRQSTLPTELWTQIASYLPVRDAALLSGGFLLLADNLLLPRGASLILCIASLWRECWGPEDKAMPAGVCRAASRLQLQSVILNPEDKDDMSAHWISMLRDTDQTTPSEGVHILHRLCIHLEEGSDAVSLGKPSHPLPIHEHERCARSIVWAQSVGTGNL